MESEYRIQKLKNLIPPELIEKAIPLQSIGIHEYAWRWRDAIEVITIAANNNKFILGGDVYTYLDEKYIHTGDMWDIKKTNYLASDSDIQKSKNASIEFIQEYIKRKGENYFFSIVVDFV